MSTTKTDYWPTVPDARVAEKTGREWSAWFDLLDSWGGPEKGHAAMSKHLLEDHGVPLWWSQMVVVEYERARGLRAVNQTKTGFELSVTRTISAPLERAWRAWTDASEMDRWFSSKTVIDLRVDGRYSNGDGDSGTYKTIDPMRRLRFTWEQPKHELGSEVEVMFETMADGRSKVILSHSKLANAGEVEDLREGWSWAMDSLRSYLETGAPIRWEDWKAARP